MKVAILGGGLSAAYAWRSCLDNDIIPQVYTDRLFVPPGGFIYSHWLPRSVDKKDLWESITVLGEGTAEDYGAKMWHSRNIKSSFPEKEYVAKGVSPIKAARALWGDTTLLKKSVSLGEVKIEDIGNIDADIIIQTFIAGPRYDFFHTPIWVVPGASLSNSVIYDGSYKNFWTRKSILFGFTSYEFPPVPSTAMSFLADKFGEIEGLISNPKAKLWYAPEIPPDTFPGVRIAEDRNGKVLYCGRWSTGNRKYLSHETYDRVVQFLKEKENGGESRQPISSGTTAETSVGGASSL